MAPADLEDPAGADTGDGDLHQIVLAIAPPTTTSRRACRSRSQPIALRMPRALANPGLGHPQRHVLRGPAESITGRSALDPRPILRDHEPRKIGDLSPCMPTLKIL
jgi:hypothetical protein